LSAAEAEPNSLPEIFSNRHSATDTLHTLSIERPSCSLANNALLLGFVFLLLFFFFFFFFHQS